MKYYVPSGQYLSYRINGAILLVVSLLVASAVLYFPVIRPNLQKRAEDVSKMEQGIVDYTFGDVSEFAQFDDCTDGGKYDGKVVSFTGKLTFVGHCSSSRGEQGKSLVAVRSIDAPDRYSADCSMLDMDVEEVENNFKRGDKVRITGVVCGYFYNVRLEHCKIEHCD